MGLDYAIGYDKDGIENLIVEIQTNILNKAGEWAVDNLTGINNACDEYWDGEAKEHFKSNLRKDAGLFKLNLDALTNALVAEIRNVGYAHEQLDKNMIEEA